MRSLLHHATDKQNKAHKIMLAVSATKYKIVQTVIRSERKEIILNVVHATHI